MRAHHHLALASTIAAALTLLGACTELSLDDRLFACTSDDDCQAGQICRAVGDGLSACLPTDADVTGPDTTDTSSPADTTDTTPDTGTDAVDTADDTDVATDTTDATDTADATDVTGDADVAEVTDTSDTDPGDADVELDTGDAQDTADVVQPQTFQVSGTIDTDTTWSAPHSYVLTEPIYVMSGTTLTIEAGVTVLAEVADSTPPGGLVVLRGGALRSLGTATEPVVFTSNQPVGQRAPGDWLGVALLGRAPVNQPDGDAYLFWYDTFIPDLDWQQYGGLQHASSCGEVRYTRIEFAGYEVPSGDRVPGLLLGACGHQTVVDHVQVHRAHGNEVSVVGGSVPLRYLYLTWSGWSALTPQAGYSGSVQFLTTWHELGGDTAITAFNDYFNDDYTPVTDPLVFNATLVAGSWRALHARRSTHGDFANLLVLGQTTALVVEGAKTIEQILAGDLDVRSSLFFDHVDATLTLGLEPCGIWLDWASCSDTCTAGDQTCLEACNDSVSSDPAWSSVFGSMSQSEIDTYFANLTEPAMSCQAVVDFDLDAWLREVGRGNVFGVNPQLANEIDPSGLYPASATSPLAGLGATPPATDAHGVALDTSATWIGAFEPGQPPWTEGWTALPEN